MHLIAPIQHHKGFNMKQNRMRNATLKKVDKFNAKIIQALEQLNSLNVSAEEKELITMSLENMSEFITNYYQKDSK